MATKKQPAKTGRNSAKSAKPQKAAAPKAPAKKPVAKAAKPAPKKAAAKPAVKAKAPVKPAPKQKAAAKPLKPAPKKAAAAKPVSKATAKKAVAPAPAKSKAAPKKAAVTAKAKPAPAVKKPAVAAPSTKEVKPAIKPLQQPEKKAQPKPAKVVIPKTSTSKAVKYNPDFTKSVLDSEQKAPSGPTMRYSDAELTEFRELITRKLETAKKELAYLQGLITRKDESGDMEDGRYMTMEDGSMSMEREQLSQMASRQIQFIDHLEKAMIRIENKTYGVCRVTGKLIDKARLRAVPHATLSIEAKQLRNR